MRLLLFIAFCIIFQSNMISAIPTPAERAKILLNAKSVQIDPSMRYYHNRSLESIASEIRVNGFNAVYCFAMSDTAIPTGLVEKLHEQGLAAALMTLPSLVYWSEADLAAKLPPQWRDWLIQFTDDRMKEYRFIGFIHPEYNAWYKPYLVNMLKTHNFDGFTFAEIMYPIYDGPEREQPLYGDISPAFQEAFKKATGNSDFPNFTDPASPNYFRNNTDLYRQLVEYRIKTINDFYNDIINGPDGVREHLPDITFATWTLGINIPNGVEKLREWEGNDIAGMITSVRPDIHFIQTHAPDWLNPDLPGDYVKGYKQFFDAIRNTDPNIKIGLQTDVGSRGTMRRNPEWMQQFYNSCLAEGVNTTTYYEFSLRWEIFNSPPELKEVRIAGDELWLVFDQYLDATAAETAANNLSASCDIISAITDGNLIRMKLNPMPKTGDTFTINIEGIADNPSVRLGLSDTPPLPYGPQNKITVPTLVTVKVL